MQHSVSPTPTDEEATAIAAAIEMLRPIAQLAEPPSTTSTTNTTWRFSGRWWVGSAVTRRSRPGS